MKKYRFLFGVMLLVATVIFTACSDDAAADKDVLFQSLIETGGISGTVNSTNLILTFDVDPTSLTINNITVTGATKGALTGSGLTRNLAISSITVVNGETVSVTITSPAGYVIAGSPQTAVVFKPFGAGDKVTYTAEAVSFKMVYVPGSMAFPVGPFDTEVQTVANAYWTGETEVTYELWQKVHDWATNTARGANRYTFANAGRQGGDSGNDPVGTAHHPVTKVNWRDSMVWCNALTEWYNTQNGTSYECIYIYSSSVVRNSGNSVACDAAVPGLSDKGFRLLMTYEWELAARWRNDAINTGGTNTNPWFTKGDSASGDIQAYNASTPTAGDYAVFSRSATAAVKTKKANALGLYDMSGNVFEWCFQPAGPNRMVRGGSWLHGVEHVQIGKNPNVDASIAVNSQGFRIARSAD